MGFDRETVSFGRLAALLVGATLIAGTAGCGKGGNTPQESSPAAPSASAVAPSSTTAESTDASSSSSTATSTSTAKTSSEPSKEGSSSETEDGSSETTPESGRPSSLTCSAFDSLGVGSQRDMLSRIAKANPSSPLAKYPDAYVNNLRATCSQDGQGSTRVLDVLGLDGSKYQAP